MSRKSIQKELTLKTNLNFSNFIPLNLKNLLRINIQDLNTSFQQENLDLFLKGSG